MALLLTIASKFKNEGVKLAAHSFNKLTHSLRSGLGAGLGALGLGLTVHELINMAEAANQDTKSARLLSDQLHRMAGATKAQRDEAEAFIQSLSMQTGIIDDTLRPSLTELTASTKNVGKAQKLLVGVLDIAAGRNKDVAAVQKAVTKSYSGNITVLQRMFPEMKKFADAYKANKGHALTFAESVDLGRKMIKKMAEDNAGQAAKMATPFDRMNIAMDNLKETLGGALLPTIEKMIPKVQEMVAAFGNPNSPESKSLKEMGDSLLQVFTDIDNLSKTISGNSAIVAFLDSIKNFALGLSYVLESTMATIDAFKGIKFDPTKYKVLSTTAENKTNAFSNFKWIPVIGAWLDMLGQANTGGQKAKNLGMGTTININGVVGDKAAVGKAVQEALNAYKKQNGIG